jgi:CheY-like chemotaxis protein
MQILYVEDDRDDYSFFVELLGQVHPGAQCTNATNGLEALQMLDTGAVTPELIVLDLNMPVLDGKDCLKSLKADARFNNIPVYVYTTGANPLDATYCKQLGAVDYLLKPNTVREANEIVRRIVNSPAAPEAQL